MIRLGIIGTGRIAKRTVAELSFVPQLQLCAVYNPSIAHGQDFAAWAATQPSVKSTGHGVQAVLDLDELATLCDAVYIATPHGTHYDYARQMLELGRHVLCEKPMCFSTSQAKELLALAERAGVVLLEGIKTAYCPGFLKIQEVIESGTIGEIVDIEATFTRLTPLGCREFDDKKYGGSFTEFGTYNMLPIFRFLGTGYTDVAFKSVPAVTGVDGYTKAEFNYDGKAFATTRTGLTVKSEGQLVIAGTKGYVLVPSPWWRTGYFEVRYEDPSHIDKYDCVYEGDGLRYELGEFAKRVSDLNSSGAGPTSESFKQLFCRERDEAMARADTFERFLKR